VTSITHRGPPRAADDSSPDLHSRLATLLETSGNFSRALDVLESLRDVEPTYPNIATRIEGLRKQITAQSEAPAGSGSRSTNSRPAVFRSPKATSRTITATPRSLIRVSGPRESATKWPG
jgi:hypothetical protein